MEQGLSRAEKNWIQLMKIGAFAGCHQAYGRSFHIKGYQFPVCARCTGLFLGELTAFIFYPFYKSYPIKKLAAFAGVFIALLGTDGIGQMLGKWVSNNRRRILTGLPCGFFTAAVFFRVAAKTLKKFVFNRADK